MSVDINNIKERIHALPEAVTTTMFDSSDTYFATVAVEYDDHSMVIHGDISGDEFSYEIIPYRSEGDIQIHQGSVYAVLIFIAYCQTADDDLKMSNAIN